MPCYKCSNGKWKYGQRGRCQFDTLEACHAAEAAIHARQGKDMVPEQPQITPSTPQHDPCCPCWQCVEKD